MPPKQSGPPATYSQGRTLRGRSSWRQVLEAVAAPENRSVVRASAMFVVGLPSGPRGALADGV